MAKKQEWFFDSFYRFDLAVCVEEGKITEVRVEDEGDGELVGNIYKGRVCNVIAGMQAAFVSCGLDKNCYLPLNDVSCEISRYDGNGAGNMLTLQEGDEILVQIDKSPRGNKGAKVTTALSFVGRTLIYLPRTDFLGISRKLTDEKVREKLLADVDEFRAAGEGFIVRTAAEGADKKTLKKEAEHLKKYALEVIEKAKRMPVGSCVYKEAALAVKTLRDHPGKDIAVARVGNKGLYDEIVSVFNGIGLPLDKKITLYKGERSLFQEYGLSEQIYELATPRAELEGGGYLIIDHTEAMTVIDVNTGKYTGESDLESTVTQTNLRAAREIARQVRLRNIGGIVTVDFIDMTEEEHRVAVMKELERALSEDRAKCRVQPMNELCIGIFTRKRVNNDIQSFLLKPCTHCTRQGFVLSDAYMMLRIRSAILDYFANGYTGVIIELNRLLMNKILSEGVFSQEVSGAWKDKRVYMIPHSTYHEEKFTIRGDNAPILTLPEDAQILY